MELFTTIAVTVGLFVLLATLVTAFLMIKTDVFTGPRATPTAPTAPTTPAMPVAAVTFDHTPRELVNS